MALEIERKFLVKDDGWKQQVQSSARLKQGYLSLTAQTSVRVRIKSDQAAWLTVKGAVAGASRYEFEYEVPVADAEAMLALSVGVVIDKVRHIVINGPDAWEVDVFGGGLAGLVIAELEMETAGYAFEQPAWLGREVTEDRRYYNAELATNGLPGV